MRSTGTIARIPDAGGRRCTGGRVCLVLLFLSPLLSACASRGFSIEGAVPDRATITGSIGSTQGNGEARTSDAATIRNAVSALDMEKVGSAGVPWMNPATGNSGVISDVADKTAGSGLCRTFRASRVTYDGVKLFHGKACMDRFGLWSLVAFKPV